MIIPDRHQRYNTVGAYYRDEEVNRVFAISDMNNWKYEMLVVVHELIEAALCQDRGVTIVVTDKFKIPYARHAASESVWLTRLLLLVAPRPTGDFIYFVRKKF